MEVILNRTNRKRLITILKQFLNKRQCALILYFNTHMKFIKPITLAQLSQEFNCTFLGSSELLISGINEIHRVNKGEIVFVDHPKYYDKALQSQASVIIIDKEVDCPTGKGLIISASPFDVFNAIAKKYYNDIPQKPFKFSALYKDVYFGANVNIGKNVQLMPGARILDGTIIGDNVVIGPNTVIGHNAFYYKKVAGNYHPMFNCGNVVISNDVEIGANCTIDRGVTDVTFIGRGTKIDNLVQIGHDTRIGENCLFASQVGIAGCVTIENQVTLWGQVGCASGITIGSGAIVLAQSGISKDIAGNATYFGSPCSEVREKFKEMAALRQLPEFLKNRT